MPARKKIAAIVTTWFPGSHADLIASKFATGFPTVDGLLEPQVDLVSLYMDQVHPRRCRTRSGASAWNRRLSQRPLRPHADAAERRSLAHRSRLAGWRARR